ncbi:unnamed protein product [Nippostrongylus brasiliensis]|uniref:Transposase n=1 Tax=Nippostrongylus brasiliensis TaxID=27835 RepID=A0A0N4XZP9_NIPBR|nr:unnamed protein product [Nippostrongylus brasiliensis]
MQKVSDALYQEHISRKILIDWVRVTGLGIPKDLRLSLGQPKPEERVPVQQSELFIRKEVEELSLHLVLSPMSRLLKEIY